MPEQVRVFISHHHSFEEDAFTTQLVHDLETAGIDVWVDEKGVTSGSFVKKISEGLKDRQWLLFIMTPAALVSPWVQSEVDAGLQEVHAGRMRGVIPVMAQPCDEHDVPILWRSLYYYDATEQYEAARDRLISTLKNGGPPSVASTMSARPLTTTPPKPTAQQPTAQRAPSRIMNIALSVGVFIALLVALLGGLAYFQLLPGQAGANVADISGDWNGTLTILTNNGPTGDIHLVIQEKADGSFTGALTVSPPLGSNNDGPITKGAITRDNHVSWDVPNNAGTQTLHLTGDYAPSAQKMSGRYTTDHGFSGTWSVVKATTSHTGGAALYQADWRSVLNGWIGSTEWKAVNGALVADGTDCCNIVAPYRLDSVSDYSIEARVQVRTANEGVWGILARVQDTSGTLVGYEAGMDSLNVNQGGSNTGYEFISRVAQTDLAQTPFVPDTNWHVYRFEVSGKQLRFFMDGALVLTAQDSAFATGGQVGLRCYAKTQIAVSSYVVKAL